MKSSLFAFPIFPYAQSLPAPILFWSFHATITHHRLLPQIKILLGCQMSAVVFSWDFQVVLMVSSFSVWFSFVGSSLCVPWTVKVSQWCVSAFASFCGLTRLFHTMSRCKILQFWFTQYGGFPDLYERSPAPATCRANSLPPQSLSYFFKSTLSYTAHADQINYPWKIKDWGTLWIP